MLKFEANKKFRHSAHNTRHTKWQCQSTYQGRHIYLVTKSADDFFLQYFTQSDDSSDQ